jgi:hypothetical protein
LLQGHGICVSDDDVDVADITLVAGRWNVSALYDPAYDSNCDGAIGIVDINLVTASVDT